MNMGDMYPSVGRIVHYIAYGTPGGEYKAGSHRAAIITDCSTNWDGDPHNVAICVLNPTGLFFNTDVPYDPDGEKPGTWHWPERV